MHSNHMKEKKINPWTPEDEREHFRSIMEWWCAEGFFTSAEDKKTWSWKASLTEWCTPSLQMGSIGNMDLFDQEKGKHFVYYARNPTAKLESAETCFDVRYEGSFMKGAYPDYVIHFIDPRNNIEVDVKYQATSLPHWVAQDVTNGWLPMGLGFYRYGFIPRCDLSGTLKINGNKRMINGTGYFEHVWGNFSYHNPLSNILELKKTVSTYAKLIGWWIHNHKLKIPNSIMFSTENNPLGYDWTWALLDNGWTLFYGNILFWIMEGPIMGSLILTKDGKTYSEFSNVSFKYNKTKYAKGFDFYYPTELELIARKENETLHLRFTMTAESRDYISRFTTGGGHWLGLVICEAPGRVEGYYSDGKQNIPLRGVCKMEPQRQITLLGHNSLRFDFLLPPKGVGVSAAFDSHYFQKKIVTSLQLAPRPRIQFRFNRIAPSVIHRNTKLKRT